MGAIAIANDHQKEAFVMTDVDGYWARGVSDGGVTENLQPYRSFGGASRLRNLRRRFSVQLTARFR